MYGRQQMNTHEYSNKIGNIVIIQFKQLFIIKYRHYSNKYKSPFQQTYRIIHLFIYEQA